MYVCCYIDFVFACRSTSHCDSLSYQMREERNSEREREVTQQTRDAAELADLKERLLRLQEENRKLQSKVGAYTMHNLVKGFS